MAKSIPCNHIVIVHPTWPWQVHADYTELGACVTLPKALSVLQRIANEPGQFHLVGPVLPRCKGLTREARSTIDAISRRAVSQHNGADRVGLLKAAGQLGLYLKGHSQQGGRIMVTGFWRDMCVHQVAETLKRHVKGVTVPARLSMPCPDESFERYSEEEIQTALDDMVARGLVKAVQVGPATPNVERRIDRLTGVPA